MKHIRIISALLIFTLALGVPAAGRAQGPKDAAPASGGGDRGPGAALISRFKAAQATGKLDALKALVYWEGAPGHACGIIEERLRRNLGLSISAIEFRPLTGDEVFYVADYAPNLAPVGFLAVIFVPPPQDSRFFSAIFVVGENDGEYMIAVAVKE